MRLDLRFSDRSLETIWCQAVTSFSFHHPDLEISGLVNLDMKMGGVLSDFISKDEWTGERGETFLLSSQGAIPAEKILFHGLGTLAGFDIETLKKGVRSMGSSLEKLAVNDFSVYIPLVEGFEKEYAAWVETIVPVLVSPFFEGHGREKEYFLKIVCCVKKGLVHLLIPIVDRLRDYFSSFLECSIIVGHEAKREIPAA